MRSGADAQRAAPGGSDREIILGIDPGSLVTGWGLVEVRVQSASLSSHGIIATDASLGLARAA